MNNGRASRKINSKFVSYYLGPYDLNNPEIPYQEINPQNKVRENEKYFDFLRLRYESRGEDPREFIFSFTEKVYDQTKFQFETKRKELFPMLKEDYQMIPQFPVFLAWYMVNRYEPLMRKLKPKIYWTLKPSRKAPPTTKQLPLEVEGKLDLPPGFSPIVKDEDIIQYCAEKNFYIKKSKKEISFRDTSQPVEIEQLPEPKKSLGWLGTEDQAQALYDVLLNNKYINCSYEVFRGVLGMGAFVERVAWLKSQRVLIFLIMYLQDRKLLPKKSQQDWVLIHSLYKEKDEKLYDTASLRSSFNTIKRENPSGPMIQLRDRLSNIF